MKVVLIAAATCLALALAPDASFAAAKKKASMAGGKCSTGAVCTTDCGSTGWCSRYVCAGGKWEKRWPCLTPWCAPAC
jgi:hypothetical protein